MATFVLVHGMWHGGWCWEKVTLPLRAAGHEVYAPTLTGLAERAHLRNSDIDLNTHVQDVVDLIESKNQRNVILVGHSLGGFVAPVIADKIPERIAHIVNLDGIVPENGKGLKDLIGDTWDYFKQRATESGDEWWCPPNYRVDIWRLWRGLGIDEVEINSTSAQNVGHACHVGQFAREVQSFHVHLVLGRSFK